MKKFILVIAVLLVTFIYAGAHYGSIIDSVNAGGLARDIEKEVGNCPAGKECYWAVHMEDGNTMCRHNANYPWEWRQPKERCGEEKVEVTNTSVPKVVEPTNTAIVEIVPTTKPTEKPTATERPIELINTPVKDWVEEDKEESKEWVHAPTATATVVPLMMQATEECNWCDLVSTIASAQSTIAAGVESISNP